MNKSRRARLSISEARAEACTLTMRLWLARLPGDELARLRDAALLEANDIGNDQVQEEVEWLFLDPMSDR